MTTVSEAVKAASPAERRAVLSRYDPATWVTDVAKLRLPKSGPITFGEHPFMEALYRDLHPEIVVIKGAQTGFCLDDKSELLSRRGWLRWDDVREGEEILTVDPATGRSRWSPVERLHVDEQYDGPMVSMTGRNVDALVTPNHRWLVKHHTNPYPAKFRETHALRGSDTIPIAAEHDGFPEARVFSDPFVELAGWVIAEGTYRRDPGATSIAIAQNDGPKLDAIRRCLAAAGVTGQNSRWKGGESRAGRCVSLLFAGPVAKQVRSLFPTKELTPEFVQCLTRSQAQLLFDTLMAGDGHWGRTVNTFYQRSKQTTDAFVMLVTLLGFSPRTRWRPPRPPRPQLRGTGLIQDRGLYETTLRGHDRRVHVGKMRLQTVPYQGVVWCPQTRDGTFVMRRNGKMVVTGNSTWAISRTLWAATQFSLSVLYTFPTSNEVSKFTQARINPMIIGSAYLAERVIDVNSTYLKQFGRVASEHYRRLRREGVDLGRVGLSTVYFGGAANEKDAQAMDVDLLIHDEEDRSDPGIIDQMDQRLAASKLKWRYRLSTPTQPGRGVDRTWVTSDQRAWMHRCSRCGTSFEMTFPEAPGDEKGCIWPEEWDPSWGSDSYRTAPPDVVHYRCPTCKEALPEEDRRSGEWVAAYPDRYVHGYRVSQMAAPWVTAAEILFKRYKAIDAGNFWNLVMGLPWDEGTNAMTRVSIIGVPGTSDTGRTNPMRERSIVSKDATFLGIDVGGVHWAVIDRMIDGKPVTINMERVQTFDELPDLMRRYNVTCCVIDGAPEEHLVRKFQLSYAPGIVWRCYYGGQEVVWNDKTFVVTAPRTEILSRSADELLTARELPRWDATPIYEDYVTHHTNSKKVPIWAKGMEALRILDRYEWHETGQDHLFHAATYAMLARMRPSGGGVPTRGLVSFKRGVERPTGEPFLMGAARRGSSR